MFPARIATRSVAGGDVGRSAFSLRFLAVVLSLLIPLDPGLGQTPARGVGPFTLKTKRGAVSVHLLRREADLVWVLQKSQSGALIETGVAVKEIEKFEIPRPKVFRAVEAAKTPERIAQVEAALGKFVDSLRPYRDLPGMIVDDALLLLGALQEKQERWAKALESYQEILAQTYPMAAAERAQLRAGLCQFRLGAHQEALELLDLSSLNEDDLDLLSAVYLARGDAFLQLKRYDDALLSYLYLVVFHPFVNDNEARCLAAVLPCYAALTDWDAAYKTAQVLFTQYAGTDYAQVAEAFTAEHEAEFAREVEHQAGGKVTEFQEDKGVYDDFE